MDKKRKVLVLGSNGFIGSHVRDHFFRSGWSVSAPTRHELNLVDRDSCEDYFYNQFFDVVIHCAVQVDSVEKTLQMFFNVAEFNINFGKMIYFGSGAEYNPRHYVPLMSEDYFGRHFPEMGYPLSKFAIASFIEKSALPIYNLRLFGVFGEREDYTRRFISNNICRVLSGLNISINKDMMFDYISVQDVCRIVENFLELGQPKRKSYNLCSGAPRKLSEIAENILSISKDSVAISLNSQEINPEYSGSPEILFEELGGVELTPLQRSIEQLWTYYCNQFELSNKYLIK